MRAFSVLITALSCVAGIQGYSIPGAYERMMYYYAYQMDCAMNNGTPRWIAPKCKGAGGGVCNLNEFIKFISPSTTATTTFGSDPKTLPDLEAAADDLYAKGMTGTIELKRCVPELTSSQNYDELLRYVSNWMKNKNFKVADEALKTAGRNAVKAVMISRIAATTNTFFEKFPGYTRGTRMVPLWEDAPAGLEAEVFSASATARGTPLGAGQSANDMLVDVTHDYAGYVDDSHKANIKVLKDTLQMLLESCGGDE